MPTIYLPPRKQREQTVNSKQAHDIYNCELWRGLRLCYMHDNPLCEECYYSKGIVTAATEVHHKIPFSTATDPNERARLAYSYSNLMSLCTACHHDIHTTLKQSKP